MNPLIGLLRRPLIHVAAFSFVVNLLLLIPALFMLQVFDRVLVSQSGETLLMLLLGAAIALGMMLALDYLRGRLQGVAGNMIAEALSPVVALVVFAARSQGVERGQDESLRDVTTLRGLFSAQGLIALFDAPWLLVYVAVIWIFHPTLGMAAAVSAATMLLLAFLNDRMTRSGIEALQREAAHSGRYLEASLANAEVVQALGMAPALINRWRSLNHKVTELQRPIARKSVAMASTTRALRQTIQIVVLALGAYLVITHEATVGVMVATTILLGRALAPVEQVVGSWRVLAEGRTALARLRELLDSAASAPERMQLPEPKGALVAQNIIYRPPGCDRLILQGVSLQLAPGAALAIVGPSAAGKSTLLRVLTGLWKPTAGIVRLDGADLSIWPREALGPLIGYVPQDVELFQGTVAENIARLGPVDPALVVSAAQRARVHEMILSLPQGYDTQVDAAGMQLSPGQRQRIALARALFGNPRLVVLDEPNSNLDGAGEQALADAIGDLRSQSVTVVIVTHRNTLIRHMTHMLVLEGGRVQQYGPTSQVLVVLDRQKKGMSAANVVQMPRPIAPERMEQAS
ncbi:MAG: type I secretion system permease/ATPase [Steroidobacteraceae bacterium]